MFWESLPILFPLVKLILRIFMSFVGCATSQAGPVWRWSRLGRCSPRMLSVLWNQSSIPHPIPPSPPATGSEVKPNSLAGTERMSTRLLFVADCWSDDSEEIRGCPVLFQEAEEPMLPLLIGFPLGMEVFFLLSLKERSFLSFLIARNYSEAH